ncbi:oxidoreductase [Aquabacterium sp.]|uniref:oxidoreductase n=1 Tax=Aquabacterium sp. TaxID=1872578 RepID=UPI0025C49109|nr:oxidoreductase [Aquabacterium sp.]
MSTHTPLQVGIVGHGFATTTFHAPLVQSVPGLRLAAMASRKPEDVRAAWPGIDALPTPEALFAREDIDLVVIPTPNDSHHPLALAALRAGKHVVVDKPFTLDVAQADELVAEAERRGRMLSVFHNRRWDADFLTVQALVQAGTLGRLAHVESHFDRYRPQVRARWREGAGPGSGLWFDLGPHLLDQTLQLFGMPHRIGLELAAHRDGALADDWFHAVLAYEDGPHAGLRVVLHGSALVAECGPRFALHGTQGSYVKFGLDPQEDQLKAGLRPGQPGWGLDTRHGTLTTARGDALHTVVHPTLPGDQSCYYATLRDAILHGGKVPVAASEARDVMRLIEAGQRSAATGHRVETRPSGS